MLTQVGRESVEEGGTSVLKYKLLKHQQKAVNLIGQNYSYALFMETGTGKTLVAIEMIKRWKEQFELFEKDPNAFDGDTYRSLVVCPLSVIEGVWMQELRKWAPQLKKLNLWAHLRGPRRYSIPNVDVYCINYESLSKLTPGFLSGINTIILDESSKIKNPKAKITKLLLQLSKKIEKKIIMTGTPAPNSPLEYWSQMYFVNPKVLGENFYSYRVRNFFNFGYGGYQWAPKKDFKVNLPKLLAQQSYSVKKTDCLDLPEQTFELRKYIMQPEQMAIYRKMVLTNIANFKNSTVLGANELAKIMKLRQITSGFFVDDTGSNVQLSDGKHKLLDECLEEIGDNQVIIWCQFHHEIKQIKKRLDTKAAILAGLVTQAQKEQAIRDFKSRSIQYLIAHPRSAGHGLNLVNATYAIYFSLSYSFEEEKQSQDRIHRIGQGQKTTYIYLVAEGSIDEKIYKALRNKEKVSEAVLRLINQGQL